MSPFVKQKKGICEHTHTHTHIYVYFFLHIHEEIGKHAQESIKNSHSWVMDLDRSIHFLLCSLLFYLKFYTMKVLFCFFFFGIFKRRLKLLPFTFPSLLIHLLPKWNLLSRENGPTIICFLFVFALYLLPIKFFSQFPLKKVFNPSRKVPSQKPLSKLSLTQCPQLHGVSLSLHIHRILYIFLGHS